MAGPQVKEVTPKGAKPCRVCRTWRMLLLVTLGALLFSLWVTG
jgi:hypothetical protein